MIKDNTVLCGPCQPSAAPHPKGWAVGPLNVFPDLPGYFGQFVIPGRPGIRKVKVRDPENRDQVDMGMRHLKAGNHDTDPLALDCFCDRMGDLFGKDHHPAQEVVIHIEEVIDLALGDHQRMPRIDRPDVQKRQIIFVFADLMTGDLTLYDAGEQTGPDLFLSLIISRRWQPALPFLSSIMP
jgi:hypothetical protein